MQENTSPARPGWLGFLQVLIIAAVVVFVLGGCAVQGPNDNHTLEAHASPRLYVFDCGTIYYDTIAAFGVNDDESDVREMIVPCYLIDHPAGRLFWDGGLPIAQAGSSERVEAAPGLYTVYPRSVVDQLARLNLTPDDIEQVSFSHLHFDHAGAANLFAKSQLLIQQAEYDTAFGPVEQLPTGFVPSLYSELRDSRRRLLNGDHDVFGDGSVQIISTPGHTPGHQVLLVRLANYGPVVLSGDLYHFRFSRAQRRTPAFNTSRERTLQAMDRVEALLVAEGATLWIEHDMALFKTLAKSPAYYD
ncbi:MAG: N-acyl homoserine lactonase family protein [Pseudomonadota bacterium]